MYGLPHYQSSPSVEPSSEHQHPQRPQIQASPEPMPAIEERAAGLTTDEMMVQSGARSTPSEDERALEEQPETFLQLSQSNVPLDIVVQDRPSSPLIRLGDVLDDPEVTADVIPPPNETTQEQEESDTIPMQRSRPLITTIDIFDKYMKGESV